MRILILLLFFLTLAAPASFADNAVNLRKISVIASNNTLDSIVIPDWAFFPLAAKELAQLKAYVESKGFSPSNSSELDFIFSGLSWVSKQWKHDGMNQPPLEFGALDILKEAHNNKTRYRCVEYGIVLTELLQAYGFVTRTLSLRSSNVAYGGFGQGHVAMEVWLNDLSKWVFLDPQFGIFLTVPKSKVPLSFYQIYLEKKSGRYGELVVNTTEASKTLIKNVADKLTYKNFLKNYFGHIAINSKEKGEVYSLLLEAEEAPLTFQAMPLNNAIFSKRPELFYPEMNRVALLFSFKSKGATFMDTMRRLKIETDADYMKNMAAFAAEPKFLVSVRSSSKVNEKYQFRDGGLGDWREVNGNTFDWSATKKTNRLEVRSVNSFGRAGPVTFIDVKYD